MPEEFKPGCKRPPIIKPAGVEALQEVVSVTDVKQKMVSVGKSAPDFTAPGYYDGKFMNFSLAEYKGKWVLVCFYPGDFTFV